jgi:structural maintenance of chromosome 4
MFELADRLVGIYKTENCTKSVSINPRAYGIQASGPMQVTPRLLSERSNTGGSEITRNVDKSTTPMRGVLPVGDAMPELSTGNDISMS